MSLKSAIPIIFLFLSLSAFPIEKNLWVNNNAMRDFCPGFCCPGYEDDTLNLIIKNHCLHHPNMKSMGDFPPWIKDLMKNEQKN
jgi:hypothetical protein